MNGRISWKELTKDTKTAFAQQVDNELSGIAFELLGKAKDLAADLDALGLADTDASYITETFL